MMDFSTPCCARPWPDQRPGWFARWALACLLALCGLAGHAADSPVKEAGALQLVRASDGLFLSTSVPLQLPALVQDALAKGIAMHFIVEAEVLRQRWYWSDKTIARAVRYLRLSYQPLTRRWRLTQSAQPFTGAALGVSLGQSFDELDEVLAVMQRIVRWKIAEADVLDAAASYQVQFQFRLDLSQLPRPLQWGVVGRSGWTLQIERSAQLAPEPEPGEAP